MYYAGIDIHKRYQTLCVLDSSGNVVIEHRRLSTEGLVAVLGELDGPISVALEATLHWAWLHDRLSERGCCVEVAHPADVKLISKARCKTDPIDARKLADLLRSGLLPTIWVPDAVTRANRQLLRGYAFQVRTRTRFKNRIHAYVAELNLTSPKTDLFGKAGRQWLDTLELPSEVGYQVEVLIELLDALEVRIRRTSKRITERVELTPEAQLLKTVPGIGDKTAMLMWAEIGDITRFATAHQLTSFAGLVPTTRSSGGRTTHGSLPHTGSPWLRWALVETTQTLKLKPGPVRAYFTRLARAKGKSKATVAAARKLCSYLYWMLKDNVTYDEWLRRHSHAEVLEVRPR